MIVVDEYLAVRVVGCSWPSGLPDTEDVLLPTSRHRCLLQRVHAPGDGQLSRLLATLSPLPPVSRTGGHCGLARNAMSGGC